MISNQPKSDSNKNLKEGERKEGDKMHSIFLGGLPPNSRRPQITESLNRALLKIGVEGEWDLELKGKKGKNGHLGFGFVHFRDKTHQKKALRIFKNAYQQSRKKKSSSGGSVGIFVLGKIIEVKNAWSVEEHKKITDKDRKKKVYISCLRKSIRRGILIFNLFFFREY